MTSTTGTSVPPPAPAGATTRFHRMPSPIGELLLTGRPGVLTGLHLGDHRRCPPVAPGCEADADAFADAVGQLSEYFAGRRRHFDLVLDPVGTEFQRRAWRALASIPYGETVTYGEQARRMGVPSAFRAVGAANGRNPISIVVPCHRVVGAGGSLVGYGWGTDVKAWLLAHEGVATGGARTAPSLF